MRVNDNDNFEIPGYKSTKLIRGNKMGRGICIFTRDYLKVKLRDDLVPENNTGEMEALFIEIIKERYYSRYDIPTTKQQIKRI